VSTAKIKTNNSARATLLYAIGKEGARVIGGNAAPWIERDQISFEEMQGIVQNATREFMISIDLNVRVKKSVGHISISFPPEEELDDQELSDYCDKYFSALILTGERPELLKNFNEREFRSAVDKFRDEEIHKYSYSVVRHTDTQHPHAHLVYSRINLETEKSISPSFERYRSQEILRDLERQYQLTIVPNSWEVGRSAQSISQLQKEATIGEISTQKRLQDLLEKIGQRSTTVPEFIENAQVEGIEVRMRFTRTGKSKGISYDLDGVPFSGNSLGTRYSFKDSDPGLCRAFNLDYRPEQDNPKIQEICQRKPLDKEQRELSATLRNELTESLSGTAEAVQQLDFSAPASSHSINEIRTASNPINPIGNGTENREQSDRSAVAARNSSFAPDFGGRNKRIDRNFEPPRLSGSRGDRQSLEPGGGRTPNSLPSREEGSDLRAKLSTVDQKLRDFESNSRYEIQRVNDQLEQFNNDFAERRASRVLRQQERDRVVANGILTVWVGTKQPERIEGRFYDLERQNQTLTLYAKTSVGRIKRMDLNLNDGQAKGYRLSSQDENYFKPVPQDEARREVVPVALDTFNLCQEKGWVRDLQPGLRAAKVDNYLLLHDSRTETFSIEKILENRQRETVAQIQKGQRTVSSNIDLQTLLDWRGTARQLEEENDQYLKTHSFEYQHQNDQGWNLGGR
jgi:hypothetical protein